MASDQINPAIPPVPFRRDEKARAGFLRAFRRHVFEDLAQVMRQDYVDHVHDDRHDAATIHRLMKSRSSFRFYSALRVASQDLLYHAVRAPIERSSVPVSSAAQDVAQGVPSEGSSEVASEVASGYLHLDPRLVVPRSVNAVDVHLMPGSYTAEYVEGDTAMGAVYDARLRISTFGVFGPDLDDIGQSMARQLRQQQPMFAPTQILDLGCTVGHNTLPWKQVYPRAEIHGIDVAAPCLRYAHQRARAMGVSAHFWQMNAAELKFPDRSFDVVFSSMFLHEVPRRDIARVFKEAYRVLRPGGVMVHMELPPHAAVTAYDSFYLDWDGHYNNEPFYRAFRALDCRAAVTKAGFKEDHFFEWVVPSWHGTQKSPRPKRALTNVSDSEHLGRLARGVRWYAFGARREA